MKTCLRALIRFYRYFLSPMLGPSCRFYPSCSEYADEAIRCHGAARGSWLAFEGTQLGQGREAAAEHLIGDPETEKKIIEKVKEKLKARG